MTNKAAKQPPLAIGRGWGGRFRSAADPLLQRFSESVSFDRRLAHQDIAGSIAHATMLCHSGILNETERDAIINGLRAIERDIEAGDFAWNLSLEDVHMNIEAALIERIGEAGKRLHTARSRNDQVATDMRLWLREAIDDLVADLLALRSCLLQIAEREADTVMPGMTHMQVAQPVSFGHHLLAWFEMLGRDIERLRDARKRVNRLPLGAGALAGTGFPIDQRMTARLLGFDDICANSLDAVSDRDFCIETTASCALLMVHLSRMAEELILWCSAPFSFVTLGDAFCTGSSIMPQKKNPDVPELIRGKSARVIAALNSLLVLMKGQPLAYNRDNQEDKEPLFNAVDTSSNCLRIFTAMLKTLRCNREVMRTAAAAGYSTATDLADYLVRRQVPFRDAHAIVGEIVAKASAQGIALAELTLPHLQQFCDRIDADVFSVLTVEGSLNARCNESGTSPSRVRAAVQKARRGNADDGSA